ncbi:hypothetical protein [Corynebacterium epidermidicanis]|uniref:DUF1648 domain-containing protein n=1 Tax=Corynebacterium epidermidicanis TaxID=1050174 RepID=A0A0G3GMW3_9CORY|nr:hypothetical protein [Corynebacterium epidermidicanis]AKK02484.1 hypothetical protein CEPID_03020 [Corynebacterium epidermidicanis]
MGKLLYRSLILNVAVWVIAIVLVQVLKFQVVDLVPVHFGQKGKPDLWGERTFFNVYGWSIYAIGVVAFGFLIFIFLTNSAFMKGSNSYFGVVLGKVILNCCFIYSYFFCFLFITSNFAPSSTIMQVAVISTAIYSFLFIPILLAISIVLTDRKLGTGLTEM